MDHRTAIIEVPAMAQWRADDEHREEIPACCRLAGPNLPLDFVEHGVLEQQVVDCVSRKAELGEDHQTDPGLVAGGSKPRTFSASPSAGR